MLRSVCVFCGANTGARPEYREAAERVGALLAARGIQLVYGGGRVGLMGVAADAALAGGGKVIGVIPRALTGREVEHLGLTELRFTGSMHERKALMADLADGFLAMPGGYGTLDELCEVLTWSQLRIHDKPVGLLNARRFFDPLLAFLDHAVAERFLRPEHRALVLVDDDPARLVDRMEEYRPRPVGKWLDR